MVTRKGQEQAGNIESKVTITGSGEGVMRISSKAEGDSVQYSNNQMNY